MLIDTASTAEMNKLQVDIFYMNNNKTFRLGCYPAKLQDKIVVTAITEGHSMQYGDPVGRYSGKKFAELTAKMKSEIAAKQGVAWDLVRRVAAEQKLELK